MADTSFLKIPAYYKSFIVLKSENLPSTTEYVQYKSTMRDNLFLQTIDELQSIDTVAYAKRVAGYVEHWTLRWDDFELAQRLLEGRDIRTVEQVRNERMKDMTRRHAMARMYSDFYGIEEDIFKAFYEARISYLRNFLHTYYQDNSLPDLRYQLAQAWKAVGLTQ